MSSAPASRAWGGARSRVTNIALWIDGFEGQREVGRPGREQPAQPPVVAADTIGDAEQDGPEPLPEPAERRGQPGDAVGRIDLQRAERRATLCLDREPEVVGCGRQPAIDRGRARLAIERVVELDGCQPRSVVAEELGSACSRRVEARRPGRIGKAARPGPEPADGHDRVQPSAGGQPSWVGCVADASGSATRRRLASRPARSSASSRSRK